MKNSARDLAMELENVIFKINNAYEESNKELSRLDLMREDILHKIEDVTFNASDGYKYSKALQLISKERRTVKYKREELQLLRQRVNCQSKQILKSTQEVKILVSNNKLKRENALGNYRPRILNIDKNDILHQVTEILNSED